MKNKKYIRIEDWPPDYAYKSYHKGYYVEAIQILHGFIECQARSLLKLVGSVHFSTDVAETWDTTNEIAYKDVIKVLFVIGQINKNEMAELLQINSIRNKMMHRIFGEHYNEGNIGIPKKEYDNLFKKAYSWAWKMLEKNESFED